MAAINLPIVAKFDSKGVDQAKAGISSLGETSKRMGVATKLAIAGAVAGVAAFGLSSLKAAAEAQSVAKSLEAITRNSGMFGEKAADIKAGTKALIDQSTQLAKLTGIDDEAFNSLKRGWAGVPALASTGADGLNNLAKVAADVAAGTGRDLESVGSMFTKAFAAPETALAKLQKQGIVFTDSQKATYKAMLDTGNAAGAQAFLIDQLGTKYKGAAEAAASPFERLKFIFEDLQETVGAALLPAFSKLVDVLGPLFEKIGPILAQAFGALTPIFDILGPIIDVVAGAFTALAPTLTVLMKTISEIVMMLLPPLTELFQMLIPIINQLVPPLLALVMVALKPVIQVFQALMTAIQPMLDLILPILVELVTMVGKAFSDYIALVLPIVLSLITQLAPIITKLLAAILPLLPKLFEMGMKLLMPIAEVLLKLAEKVIPILIPIIDGLADAFIWLVDNVLGPLIDAVSTAFDWFSKLLGLDGKKIEVTGSVIRYNNDGSTDHDNNPATKMAQGGIVMPRPGGLFANIAEAGKPEAVIPLDRLDSMMSGNGATVNITVNAGIGTNGAQVGAEIVSAIKTYERSSGPVFAKA